MIDLPFPLHMIFHEIVKCYGVGWGVVSLFMVLAQNLLGVTEDNHKTVFSIPGIRVKERTWCIANTRKQAPIIELELSTLYSLVAKKLSS
jgi:hypothetical protein